MVGALPGLTGTMAHGAAAAAYIRPGVHPGGYAAAGRLLRQYLRRFHHAILINTPGTPASAATSLDGYPMAQKGHGLRALHDALSASTIGGLFSCAVLLFAAPPIASFALKFGPAEYFAWLSLD